MFAFVSFLMCPIFFSFDRIRAFRELFFGTFLHITKN